MDCCHTPHDHKEHAGHDQTEHKPSRSSFPLLLIGAIVIVIALFAWVARPNASSSESSSDGTASSEAAPTSSGSLEVSETSFDFGTISMAAGKVSKTVTVKNTGKGPVTLTKLYTSCMCTTASVSKGEEREGPFGMPMHGPIPTIALALAPGEEASVEIVFDPAAHGPAGVGKISRTVTLESDAADDLKIDFAANVTP